MIADVAKANKIVVEKSTVPVRAAESIMQILKANQKPGSLFRIKLSAYNKYFLCFSWFKMSNIRFYRTQNFWQKAQPFKTYYMPTEC